MNKGELMKTKFTEDQLKHIDASLPTDVYRKYDGDSYYMVMDYNSNPLGELVDMRKVKDLDSKYPFVRDLEFDEILEWKKRVISSYLKYGKLTEFQCRHITNYKNWETQNDMIKAMSFMKHYLPKGWEWNLATYEELITL